jgi:hypothetical protein
MKRSAVLCRIAMVAILSSGSVRTQPVVLDDFEDLSGWHPIVSEGAKLNITSGEGKVGKAMVMDFELLGVYGYVIAEKDFSLDLPPNYQFTFDLKADIPVNNFEFKLIDEKENVFWIKKLNVHYPKAWERQRIKKRHIAFAWGPSGGGEIHAVRKIQFVVSSGLGGKGQVYIDNFRFEPIDDSAAKIARATFNASSMKKGGAPTMDEKGTVLKNWHSAGHQSEWLSIDFNYLREIGGIVIDWERDNYATSYDVQLSDDGKEWTAAYGVTSGNGGRDYIYLPDKDARIVRLSLRTCKSGDSYGIARLEIKGPEFSSQPNDFFSAIANESPKGLFPKYFLKQQSFWTVIGTSGDDKEALINEQGAIEVDKLSFSLEPFLFLNGRLVTWNDVELKQSLENDYLPIPSVQWTYGGWKMTVEAFSAGVPGNCMLIATYRVESSGAPSSKGKLFIAMRPFQVNPPWQWLNAVGGASRIDSIWNESGLIHVNEKNVIPLVAPSAFGATAFDNGDVTEYLQRGILPQGDSVKDPHGFSSGALEYDFDVPSGSSAEFQIVVPFHEWHGTPTPNMSEGSGAMYARLAHESTTRFWQSKLDKVQIKLPPSAQPIINTIKSNLAYIFINRDGPRIQPGSRTYERSWIRDGSLTSTALLELGITDEVRDFIDWYAKYQFPSGKIPCVVDTRGGDPTPEHDSHGEFIYAVSSYFNFTHDTTWLRSKFENVVKAVRYIQSLRAERKTDVYKNGTPEQQACYGLVPESISHEGYWNKPMHSYWDDFFVLRGLKDATAIAGILGEKKMEAEFAAERDDFRKDLYASMRLAMKNKNINYIPGCAELGDFDATSTTIAVSPCNELGNIPEPQLHNTFDKYYDYFKKRRDNTIEWKDYTPYENRVIGTFVYLDEKQRAHEALNFFMKDRRPQGWNHWAEVVYRDPSTPKYIGDMPHTWCGSDFIRSVRAMFVYERERDTALVVGAGIPEQWLSQPAGIEVKDLPTFYGLLSYSMKKAGSVVRLEVTGSLSVPGGWLVIKSPLQKKIKSVIVSGVLTRTTRSSEFTIRKLPASIQIRY